MTDARFTVAGGAALVLEGRGTPPAVELVGARAHVDGIVETRGDGWTAKVPLRASRWGGPELPLPSGEYTLRMDGTATEANALAVELLGTVRASLDGSTVRIGPPIDPAYDSGEGQGALEVRYAGRPSGG